MVTTKLVSVEDLERMEPDDTRRELIRGDLQVMAPVGGEHNELATEFVFHLRLHVGRRGKVYAPDAGFVIERDPDTLLAPDVAYVSAERLPPRQERRGFLRVIPDLVVEIVSPWDRMREVEEKVRAYLDAGVRLVWVVEPRLKTVTIWDATRSPRTLGEQDVLDGGDVLPEFRVALAEIFAD